MDGRDGGRGGLIPGLRPLTSLSVFSLMELLVLSLSKARLEKYKKSLAEARKLKRALKVMIEYLGSIKQSDDGFQVRPGTVYRMYEEAYYKVMLDMCGCTARYNRIVSSLALNYDKLKAISLPEKLNDEKVGCSDKDLERAQQKYYRAEGREWGVASHLDGDESFSKEELSDQTSIETKPRVLGKETKQVIRVEKSFTINTKTMAKLTNDKGELTIEPEVRNWVEFYQGFKNTSSN